MRKRFPQPLLKVSAKERPSATILQDDIEDWVLPTLKKYGYIGKVITGKEYDLKLQKEVVEDTLSINPRLLLKSGGRFVELYKKGAPDKKIVLKTFVLDKAHPKHLGTRPRWSIGKELYEILQTKLPDIRIKLLTPLFAMLNIHFLIITKTGQFWLGKYSDIPDHTYALTYHRKPERLDRLVVKAGEQRAQFHSLQMRFKQEIDALIIQFNKIYTYDNK